MSGKPTFAYNIYQVLHNCLWAFFVHRNLGHKGIQNNAVILRETEFQCTTSDDIDSIDACSMHK